VNRRLILPIAAGVLVLLVVVISMVVFLRRGGDGGGRTLSELLGMRSEASIFESEIEEWTPAIQRRIVLGDWAVLDRDLDRLQQERPEEYASQRLDYLHVRALVENGAFGEAFEKLTPFLRKDSAFHELALRHAEAIASGKRDEPEASRLRRSLIREYPESFWRNEAIEREIDFLAARPEELLEFSREFGGSFPAPLERELAARSVEALLHLERIDEAIRLGFTILGVSVADDAAERVWAALDRDQFQSRYSVAQRHLLARAAHSHRHFERAAELLGELRSALPGSRYEINFAIGRAYFFHEDFEKAEQAYLRGAAESRVNAEKARFFFHASRAAQLRGDDEAGERWLTSAIAVPGRFDATAAALNQRMRLRLSQKRWTDAANDLRVLRQLFPRAGSLVEGSIVYAVSMVAAGRNQEALSTLGSIRRPSDPYDRAEIAYWAGRAHEADNPLLALDSYLSVLRSEVFTHYKWFVQERLQQPVLQREVAGAIARRKPRIEAARAAGDWATAKELQTDIVVMTAARDRGELGTLRTIYGEMSPYGEIAVLRPLPLPRLPLPLEGADERDADGAGDAMAEEQDHGGEEAGSNAGPTQEMPDVDRGEILIALGLPDEAVDRIPRLYPLNPMRSALTQSKAQGLAGATRPSIYAIEVMMRSVPNDFQFELLPAEVQSLLYPRYFESLIARESERYQTDPVLVRSIMREESRFDPRAKSVAAARGLLQFIISTARTIGASIGMTEIDSSDLYEPETIVRLGAKYVADLMETFDGNHYRAAAAYNAGPNQSKLWSRLAAGEEDDYFFAAINFDETRHYVRKVLNSYRRYEQLYGQFGRQSTQGSDTDEADRTHQRRPDAGHEEP
jgi:soluble lytic murein transglycosylase-like protein